MGQGVSLARVVVFEVTPKTERPKASGPRVQPTHSGQTYVQVTGPLGFEAALALSGLAKAALESASASLAQASTAPARPRPMWLGRRLAFLREWTTAADDMTCCPLARRVRLAQTVSKLGEVAP